MKNVCVITGGGSGMGLAAAKCMPKDKIIVEQESKEIDGCLWIKHSEGWSLAKTPTETYMEMGRPRIMMRAAAPATAAETSGDGSSGYLPSTSDILANQITNISKSDFV